MAAQSDNDVHGEMVTGWRGPTRRAVLDFGRYLTGTGPAVPPSVDDMSRVPTWNGSTNKLYGTCGPCSYANLVIMAYQYLTGEVITVTDDQIFAFYRASGNPNFNPQTDQGDDGVDNSVMLAAAQHTGLEVTHADGSKESIKAVAYGTISGGDMLDQIHEATALFGGVILGVQLDVAQQNQTRATPAIWSYVPGSGIWGGHDVFGGAYTGQAGSDEQVISWLKKVGINDNFLSPQVQEVFAVIIPVMLDHAPILQGIDWPTLANDFQQLTGRPFPVPIPTPPSPAPPGPTPVPPAPAIVADSALNTAFKTWQQAKGLS
jgi:hypothetical protein